MVEARRVELRDKCLFSMACIVLPFFHCILQCKHMDDRINVEGGPFTGNILMFPPLANGEVVEGRTFFI